MVTVTFEVTEDEKRFIQAMVDQASLSLSELIRTKILERLEDEYDARLGQQAHKEYLEDLAKGITPVSIDQILKEFGIDPNI